MKNESTKSCALIEKSSLEVASDTFQSLGWFFPAYFQIGYVLRIERELSKRMDTDEKDKLLETYLNLMYEPKHLAAMLLYRYQRVSIVSAFAEVIAEAIETFQIGLVHISVVSLVPVVEGIIRRVAIVSDEYPHGQYNKKRLLGVISELVQKHVSNRERVMLLRGVYSFFDKILYCDTRKYNKKDGLSRHGMLHGIYHPATYGISVNFYKLISLLDIMTFILSLQTSGVSCLAPDCTKESDALVSEWLTLRYVREKLKTKK